MNIKYLIAGLAGVVLLFAAGKTEADTIGFSDIDSTDPPEQTLDISSQFSVEVTESDDQVLFTFYNDGPITSYIADIYFDDSTSLLSGMSIAVGDPPTSPGVLFLVDSPPPPFNFPQGDNLSPDFEEDFKASADKPGTGKDGVDESETLGILFEFSGGSTLTDIITALVNADLRIGLHVQGIGDEGFSDSYVTVPEPSTLLLLCLSAVCLMGYAWRWRKCCRLG